MLQMILNPKHVEILLEEPLKILPKLIEGKSFNSWPEKAYYLRDNVDQEILKSSYLIVMESMEKICAFNDPKDDDIINLHLDHIDIFFSSLTDDNAAKLKLIVPN
jgi:hypothetical protein